MAAIEARYVHTNLIAHDWRALARFYQEVFGCTPVPPERHDRGVDLDRGTGLTDAVLTGAHLRLPGCGPDGPTLEVFQYDPGRERFPAAVNRPGYGHIAFAVDDVVRARETVLAHGGDAVGEVVTLERHGGLRVTWCYVTDPEGNVVELQHWGC